MEVLSVDSLPSVAFQVLEIVHPQNLVVREVVFTLELEQMPPSDSEMLGQLDQSADVLGVLPYVVKERNDSFAVDCSLNSCVAHIQLVMAELRNYSMMLGRVDFFVTRIFQRISLLHKRVVVFKVLGRHTVAELVCG